MLKINMAKYAEATDGNGTAGLPSGAYIAHITAASEDETRSGKQQLVIVWDIAEGEHTGIYSDQWADEHPFAHCYRIIIDDTCMWKLKRFLGKLEQSNVGFSASDWVAYPDPQKLVGLMFGFAWSVTSFSTPYREITDIYSTVEVMDGKAKVQPDYEKPKPKPVTYTAQAQQPQQQGGYRAEQQQPQGYYDPVPFGNPNIGR